MDKPAQRWVPGDLDNGSMQWANESHIRNGYQTFVYYEDLEAALLKLEEERLKLAGQEAITRGYISQLEAAESRLDSCEATMKRDYEQYQAALETLQFANKLIGGERDEERAGRLEALRRLEAYRERTIVRGSFGAKCNVCRGEWAYTRGDELHEDWCPNRPIVVERQTPKDSSHG